MIYCQSCLTRNEPGAMTCKKCGAKLLVLGRNQQWDEPEGSPLSMDDHFLERISRLEETVGGILEHLSRMSETLEMLDRNSFVTRSGLAALIETLRETNLLREERLNEHWENTMAEQMEEAGFRDRFAQMRGRFIALYRGTPEQRVNFANLIEEAEFLIYSDRSRESADVLAKALDLDMQNYELAQYLAEYHQQNGQNHKAIEFLNHARRANPDHAETLLMLALLTYGDGRAKEATKLLTRSIELAPHNPVALLSMGSILTAEQRFEEAAPFLKRVNELDPQAQAYYLLGVGAKDGGRVKEAINLLEQATDLDPTHEDAIFALGMAYLERGWTRKAKTCFSRAQALNPTKLEFSDIEERQVVASVDSLGDEIRDALNAADELRSRGKHKEALHQYRQLLKKRPNHPILLSSCAVAYYSLRRYDETLRLTQKLIDGEFSDNLRLIAYTLHMEALRANSRYPEAVALLTRMREVFADGYGRTIANYGMAMTLADMGQDLAEAETMAREAVAACPPEFRHNALDALGWVYFKQGRYEEALEVLASVVHMRESSAHLYHYGMILLALNLQEEAFKVFERTVRLRDKAVQVDEFIYAAIHREIAAIPVPED